MPCEHTGVACQRAHWGQGHKKVCKKLTLLEAGEKALASAKAEGLPA